MVATNAPAQIATGVGAGVQPTVSFAQVQAIIATATGSAGLPGVNVTAPSFPAQQLGLRVDLNLGGTWTDITRFVYQRNPVQITNVGRADWTSTLQPAGLTLTVNNRDGRFTPKLSTGAYFPNITRNTQIRVFLSATSGTGLTYSGFRFYGEVTEWPPHWDPSGREVSVDIIASGIWRRMSQLQTSLGSAFRRFIVNGAASTTLRSYWPMEDSAGSGYITPYGSVAGTGNGIQQFIGGQTGLSFASSNDFKGSDGIPVLNAALATFNIPAGGTPTNNVIRFLISVPANGDSASGTTNWNLVEVDTAGAVAKFELYLNATGTLLLQGRNSSGNVTFSGTTTTNVKGTPYLVSMELTAGVNFALRIISQGAAGITESITGSLGAGSVGAVTKVIVSRAGQLMDTAFGHLNVAYGTPTSLVQAAGALNGYIGERAVDRFTRICGEMGIASAVIGTSSSSAAMGPQLDDTLTAVLQTIEDTDCGLLYELRDQFGLGYRTNASMANQTPDLTLNYAAATVDADLAASYDDSLTRNNITVSNWTGYTQQAILTAGAMSVLNPPSGIGNGYAYSRSVNAATDAQIPGIATFLLNIGATDEIRFPTITVKMRRTSSAPFFVSIPNMNVGDYIQITNPPAFLTTTTIKQLMWGYSETLNAKEWTFSWNTVPETAWETAISPGTIQTSQIPGGSPSVSTAPGSGQGQIILNGSITPAMLNEGISIRTLGGSLVTISVGAPTNPNTNDIWINSGTGLISQWNGSVWAPILFNATNTIQAGTIISSLIAAHTIVASNIAAGTITAAEILAGTVVAGFVDATIIQAAEILSVSTDTLPDYLAYQGSIAAGNLITSIAPVAGTDTVTNPYPKGIMSQQLTLPSQSGAPAAFSGASQLYTSSQGRLRYLSSTGNDLVLDRCVLDLTNFSMGTQTIPHILSSTLNYIANEAIVGSEYEIECDGTYTTPAGTSATFTFDFFLDGVTLGSTATTVGTVINQTGLTYAFTVRWRITVNATGAGGSVTVAVDGGLTRKGVNIGGTTSQLATINNIVASDAFDTTANHDLAMYCNWSSTVGTGHSAIVYRTRKTRRN
jgi:hypothetical protein